ncbi:MAG: hypothetical protein GY711_32660 [bacterium]|nr:hypothetical protein [bacterium]
MSPTVGFLVFLILTLPLLAAVVRTGLRGERGAHIKLVVVTVISLGITIYYAERLGELYDLESAGRITPIHLMIAKITVVAYLLPVVTGVWTWYDGKRKKLHGAVAWAVLALTVATAVTGVMMVLRSTPLE